MEKLGNIFITGTPATGKTTLCRKISQLMNYVHINLSEVIKANRLYESYDSRYESYIIDEILVRYKYFDLDYSGLSWLRFCKVRLVFVCFRSSDEYGNFGPTTTENIQSEIFQTILDEANEHFGNDKVIELQNNNDKDLERNIELIIQKIRLK
ncbi:hypothetical protein HZS_3308 [Henneguya salminicola]|nr:hypothetical protein HZS_3308 [Henneguya salminicola]